MKVPSVHVIEPIKYPNPITEQEIPLVYYGCVYQQPQKIYTNLQPLQQDTFQKQEPQPLILNPYYSPKNISFGYKSILKDLFREGEMPSVTHGIYGNLIDNNTVSLDHLKPHSVGGKSVLSNFALAHAKANSARGNNPLPYFLNKEMLEAYLSQFDFVIPGKFNGYIYQDMIRQTCKELGVGEKLRDSNDILRTLDIATPASKVVRIDYGNLKDVVAHLNDVDTSMLSKSMLRSLKNRGYI
jgi:hypothetical protein